VVNCGAVPTRPSFTTERLYLTARSLSDVEDCLRMDLDRRVTRFAFAAIEESEHCMRIRQAICEDVHPNYGFWVARKKATGIFTGWVYLKPFHGTYTLEIGYRFRHDFWGQGFAAEAATAVIAHAFSSLGASCICAVTSSENLRSIALLKRLGFSEDGTAEAYGSIASLYSLGSK
jgi:RimJ/RimL family protein N-acetyltransferase